MKFTLTYDGQLNSNSVKQKWKIRNYLSSQMQELWDIDPALREIVRWPYVPLTPGWFYSETHHSIDDSRENPRQLPANSKDVVNLIEPITREGKKFIPLIRNSLGLKCGLKINFLRKEPPGRVYQGGDIDNRLKTLFDSLCVPNKDQMISDDDSPNPIYCLMEDDCLISGISVETGFLLSRSNSIVSEVRLIIEVDVRVAISRLYNSVFLGS